MLLPFTASSFLVVDTLTNLPVFLLYHCPHEIFRSLT